MTSSFPRRSQWVRCCCIVSVSIASAAIYWRLSRSVDQSDASDSLSHGQVIEEAELAPTLINAQEIHPTLNPSLTANTTWNPEPNWNPAWTIEQLPRPASAIANSTPIPEAFPLEPRLKKEPPAIGEAFVSLPTNLLRPSANATSSTRASPFGPPISVAATPREPAVRHEMRTSIPTPTRQQPDWPDQTYASSAILPGDSSGLSDKPTVVNELATPHLLTGLEVRTKQRIPQPTPPVTSHTSGFSVKPNQPNAGNYILQPMRNQPK